MIAAFDRLFPLARGEFRRPSHFHAVRRSALLAFAGAGANQFALELGQPTQHREHEPSA
jgi:hypothetical protein